MTQQELFRRAQVTGLVALLSGLTAMIFEARGFWVLWVIFVILAIVYLVRAIRYE